MVMRQNYEVIYAKFNIYMTGCCECSNEPWTSMKWVFSLLFEWLLAYQEGSI
jgi:hypothetical protein